MKNKIRGEFILKFLIVGDVCGRPGREAFRKYVPELKKEHNIDVVVVNGENIAGGRGISRKTLDEIYRAGADIVTSGNHIWDQKEIVSFIDDEPFLIRSCKLSKKEHLAKVIVSIHLKLKISGVSMYLVELLCHQWTVHSKRSTKFLKEIKKSVRYYIGRYTCRSYVRKR